MCRVLVAIDGQPRGLLPNLFEVDDRRVVLVLIISIKPDDGGKGALPLEADEIIAGDRPHIHDLSESRANGHERAGQCTQDDAAPQHVSKDRKPSLACLIPWRIVAGSVGHPQTQSTEAVSFDASVNEAGPAPLSCTTRAPWRRVMRAAGQRATAAQYVASATSKSSTPATCSTILLASASQISYTEGEVRLGFHRTSLRLDFPESREKTGRFKIRSQRQSWRSTRPGPELFIPHVVA